MYSTKREGKTRKRETARRMKKWNKIECKKLCALMVCWEKENLHFKLDLGSRFISFSFILFHCNYFFCCSFDSLYCKLITSIFSNKNHVHIKCALTVFLFVSNDWNWIKRNEYRQNVCLLQHLHFLFC